MMIMETSSRRPPLEPVLPLINVVFLLLIFFMLAGQLATSPAVSVEPPLSQSANGPEAHDKLLLVLQKDGQWFAGDSDTPLTEPSLQEYLADRQQGAEVRLLADASITMTTLRQHLEILQGLGVQQVRLVTRSEGGSE